MVEVLVPSELLLSPWAGPQLSPTLIAHAEQSSPRSGKPEAVGLEDASSSPASRLTALAANTVEWAASGALWEPRYLGHA